jgi:hypothetical protein
MTDELIDDRNQLKIKGKFKIPKVLIVILAVILLIGIVVTILWKMGIVAKVLAPKPGSCLILIEDNCKKVSVISLNGVKIAVAKLPKGSIVFSPINGQYNNTLIIRKSLNAGENDQDYGATVKSSDNKKYTFLYSKLNERKLDTNTSLIKAGDQIGSVNSVSLKNYGDYNFILSIIQITPNSNKSVSLDDVVLKMFINNQ